MCVRGVCIFQYVCRFLTALMEATHATHLTIDLYTCISSLDLVIHSSTCLTQNINSTQPRCVSWNFGMQGMHSVLAITETKLLYFSLQNKPNILPIQVICIISCFIAYFIFTYTEWTAEGCETDLSEVNEGVVTCNCNHLTNFAVLSKCEFNWPHLVYCFITFSSHNLPLHCSCS